MRVGLIYFQKDNSNGALKEIAGSLAEGIGKQGIQVDTYDGFALENRKLSFYDYICIGAESSGFFSSKLPERVEQAVKGLGLVSGRRSYAFTVKNGVRSMKTLSRIMDLMEKEGLYLKRSDIIKNRIDAEYIGKKLHISR